MAINFLFFHILESQDHYDTSSGLLPLPVIWLAPERSFEKVPRMNPFCMTQIHGAGIENYYINTLILLIRTNREVIFVARL